jgi:hypothetical protein
MLFIEAHDMTADELADLRTRHDIVDRPGTVTTLHARKVGEQIVWSIQRMKQGYWNTLQERRKKAETEAPSLV